MFEQFTAWHILPLLVATATTVGGVWPFFDARGAMLEFGYPVFIVEKPATHPVMITSSARSSILGALMLVFYFQGKLVEMDTVLALFGVWAGFADWYALRGQNNSKSWFRLFSGLCLGTWGFLGLSMRGS